ncbi:MAG: D-alanyl-D-alanine carboxypeptidase, partial [Candidatus Collierbacteria bacterium GW2011_GWB1_44_6]
MGLTQGEKLTLEELLYGSMLVSGNDAAVTIAEGVSGSENAFVDAMNSTADDMGLSDTKFVNASGLDDDGKRHQKHLNTRGKLLLVEIPPYLPHAVRNLSADFPGFLLELADAPQTGVEKLNII